MWNTFAYYQLASVPLYPTHHLEIEGDRNKPERKAT
jgi:hypothetical protein